MNKIMKRISGVLCVLLLCGMAQAQSGAVKSAACNDGSTLANCGKPAANDPAGYFNLNFVVKEMEDGKVVSSREAHTMSAFTPGRQTNGDIKTGDRVPIVTGIYEEQKSGRQSQVTYIDLGININFSIKSWAGGKLLINTNGTISSGSTAGLDSVPDPVIHSLNWSGDAIVSMGKPVVLLSADDATSKRTFVVELTTTEVK
jgi:hypothetical protein